MDELYSKDSWDTAVDCSRIDRHMRAQSGRSCPPTFEIHDEGAKNVDSIEAAHDLEGLRADQIIER